jgi:hypothetical protein
VDRHAGFAASIAIRQQLLQDLIRVLYNANQLRHVINVSQPTISANLYLSVPSLICQPFNGNRLAIDLYAWGPMTITPPGGAPESRRVKFRVRALVPVSISISGGRLVFSLVADSASATNVQIDPYSGGLFSQAAVNYLLSPEFQALLTLGLQLHFMQMGAVIPPLRIDFLGAIAVDPTASVVSRILDGVLALGIDVNTPDGRTQGNPQHLVDTTSDGNHIGMWTNPAVVDQAFPDVRAEIETAVLQQGATLDAFDMRVEEGWMRVAGRASKTGGAVNFSLHAVPKLVRPGTTYEWEEQFGEHFVITTPAREELYFDPQDIVVDIDRDWWVIIAEGFGLLLAGIGMLIVEAFVSMVRGNVTSAIDQNDASRAARNQEFTISGVSRPRMQLRIEDFECHFEGIYAGLTIKPQFWWATLDGPRGISVEEALVQVLRYKIGLPPDALPDDPELRIRWTLRRTDTNAILATRDTQAQSGLNFSFDGNVVPFLEVSRLSLEWRVFRTLGAGAEEIFGGQQYIDVRDYVDRSHPFVRWDHEVDVPIVRVEADGTQTLVGRQIILRRSAIHRTALPGRCQMLRRHSTTRLLHPDQPSYPLIYLDALPFPPDEIIPHRGQLCDYCFFGGPDKDVPLI